jgi:uridine kinase
MKPILIGIAGRSGAGKSEIARQLAAWLPGHPQVVSLDSYYYAMDDVPLEERGNRNFDHPDSLDWPLIVRHVEALARGESIEEPIYIFATHTRSKETKPIRASKYVILEGLFTLHDERVRQKLGARIFIETPDGVCFERRKERDVVERGRTVPDIERQYGSTVRPMAEQYVVPTSKYADLVLRGDMPLAETVAVVKAFLQPPQMLRGVPVFPAPGLDRTIGYYVDALGFEREGPNGVRRDHIELRFESGPAFTGSYRIQVTEIEKLHRELVGSECKTGTGEFTVTDCNGMKLVFFENHPAAETTRL